MANVNSSNSLRLCVALQGSPKGDRQVIVPRKGVQEISRLLEHNSEGLQLRWSSNHVRVETSTFTFTSKLIDGRYPDYTKVLPTQQGKTLVANRESLREALGRDFRVVVTLHDYFSVCPNGGLFNYVTQKHCLKEPMSISCMVR